VLAKKCGKDGVKKNYLCRRIVDLIVFRTLKSPEVQNFPYENGLATMVAKEDFAP
jgi:hypothetical protein